MSKMDLVTVFPDYPAGGRNGIKTKKDIARPIVSLSKPPHPRLKGRSAFIFNKHMDPNPLLLSLVHEAPEVRRQDPESKISPT